VGLGAVVHRAGRETGPLPHVQRERRDLAREARVRAAAASPAVRRAHRRVLRVETRGDGAQSSRITCTCPGFSRRERERRERTRRATEKNENRRKNDAKTNVLEAGNDATTRASRRCGARRCTTSGDEPRRRQTRQKRGDGSRRRPDESETTDDVRARDGGRVGKRRVAPRPHARGAPVGRRGESVARRAATGTTATETRRNRTPGDAPLAAVRRGGSGVAPRDCGRERGGELEGPRCCAPARRAAERDAGSVAGLFAKAAEKAKKKTPEKRFGRSRRDAPRSRRLRPPSANGLERRAPRPAKQRSVADLFGRDAPPRRWGKARETERRNRRERDRVTTVSR